MSPLSPPQQNLNIEIVLPSIFPASLSPPQI